MVGGLVTADIKCQMLAFFNDNLKGRKVKGRVGGIISDITVFPERGIPQGTALGPDMYNVGSYDIPMNMKGDGGAIDMAR